MELNKLTMIYNVNKQKTINIFGINFVEKNKNNCKIIYNKKEYELTSEFEVDDINLTHLEIALIITNIIKDIRYKLYV